MCSAVLAGVQLAGQEEHVFNMGVATSGRLSPFFVLQ